MALLVIATACGPKKESTKPAISGAAGEVIVVIPKAQWEGEAGSAIRGVLADALPVGAADQLSSGISPGCSQ